MKIRNKIIGSLVAVLALLGVGVGTGTLGSVNIANDYQATTTAFMAQGHNVVIGNSPATLGSIVVASSSATTFRIWNATSTTDGASTTVATFASSPANGTYTFDVALTRGLIVETPTGFNGDYVITFRQR